MWTCEDCGMKFPQSVLDENNKDREAKGITIKARFVNCKNTGKHIPGVAGKVFSLTEKGKRILDVVTKCLDEEGYDPTVGMGKTIFRFEYTVWFDGEYVKATEIADVIADYLATRDVQPITASYGISEVPPEDAERPREWDE